MLSNWPESIKSMRDLRSVLLLFKHPVDLIVGGSGRRCVGQVRGKRNSVCIVGLEELKCKFISFWGYFREKCRICSVSDTWKKEILAIAINSLTLLHFTGPGQLLATQVN
jgi:hypothetical protein